MGAEWSKVGELFSMAKAALGADVDVRDMGRHLDLDNPHVP